MSEHATVVGESAQASTSPPATPQNAGTTNAPAPPPPGTHRSRTRLRVVGGIILCVVVVVGLWWFISSYGTVSTDDAYVNGHVTFVAPRVSGQVARVLVEDNNRVRKGDLLVQLDKEPYVVQLNIATAAVDAAQSDLGNAQAQARGLVGQARSARFALEHAIEQVDNQVALLHAKIASLNSARATESRAKADFERVGPLVKTGAASKEEFDRYQEGLNVANAATEEAMQAVYQVRVSLGLPPKPQQGDDLAQVPPDLNQTFSSVRQAQATLIQAASQLGVVDSFNKSPKQLVADFYKRDPQGDIDRIYEQILRDAPSVKQASSKLAQARRNLEQAQLNLRYTDVVAEIDGVVTRREVNPGNNVTAGQAVMGVRSITDIWIDANFKETQLAKLKIGQPVDLDVDMYGGREHFKGRITGFTMGTGSTLALLPPENATGNFVKVVQRLPVRIDLVNYDPERAPLFVGLSVTPTVDTRATPEGDHAGSVLQPYLMTNATAAAAPTTMPAVAEPTTRSAETVR
jgi:membrane fusion protein (multidrug efflux system)